MIRAVGTKECRYSSGVLVNSKELREKRIQSACGATRTQPAKEYIANSNRESAGCLTYAHLGVVKPKLQSRNYHAPPTPTSENMK